MKTYKEFIFEDNKKVIRRNLPINVTYKLIDSYYTGGVIDNPDFCENCGKVIANVGIIQNPDGDKFHVGMDCAATLSGIKNSSEYDETMNNFNEATALRTKIRNNKKKNPDGHLKIKNGINNVIIEFSESKEGRFIFRVYQSYNFVKKYLPEIYELIENKDKNEFTPKYSDTDDFGFDFTKIKPPRLRENDYSFKVDDYDVLIKDIQITAPNGTTVNDHIGIFISKNDKILMEDTTYMPRDVKHLLVYNLNKIDFDNYKFQN